MSITGHTDEYGDRGDKEQMRGAREGRRDRKID